MKYGANIDGDFPICHKEEENINLLFKNCELGYSIWPTININCPNPNNKTLTLLMARAYLDS